MKFKKAAEEKMNTITLQDIINTYYQRTSMQNDLQEYYSRRNEKDFQDMDYHLLNDDKSDNNLARKNFYIF